MTALTRPGRPVSPALRDAYVRAVSASLLWCAEACMLVAMGQPTMAAMSMVAADEMKRRAERLRP